jgi:hypothetical protein
VKEINRRILGVAVTLILVAALATPLISTVQAKKVTKTEVNGYTQYVGTLGGADFVVRIPKENWNGMLVIGCHAYISSFAWPNLPMPAQFAMDNLKNGDGVGLPFALVAEGYAYAASSYGEGGFPIKEAMIRTHQLTQYVIDNFGVTGKVFIIGISMGGLIGLLLGEKYPELYDGVLDISGMRDIVLGYTDSVELIEGYDADPMNVPQVYWPLIPNLRRMVADMEVQFGGTYDDKPQHYKKLNPVDNAEISIPMISVTGAGDPLSVNQVYTFRDAVIAAGCEEYYKLYVVPGGHANAPTIVAALSHLDELVDYPVGW